MLITTCDKNRTLKKFDFRAQEVAYAFMSEVEKKLGLTIALQYKATKSHRGACFGKCTIIILEYQRTFKDVLSFSFHPHPKDRSHPVGWIRGRGKRKQELDRIVRRIADAIRCEMRGEMSEKEKLYNNLREICNIPT